MEEATQIAEAVRADLRALEGRAGATALLSYFIPISIYFIIEGWWHMA